MKVSLEWLREYTDIPMDPREYAERMVMAGTGVEGVADLLPGVSGVVVARVLTCEKHPDSDHLSVCRVDAGTGEPLRIVCGAPNVRAGQLVPAALVGAQLPGGMTIRKGKIRGVESEGMLCSAAELGIPQELYPSVGEAGLLILNEEYAPGTDLLEALGLKDTVVDFDILANRPDCLSVRGLARETSAALDAPYREAPAGTAPGEGDIGKYARVSVEDPDLCPRYMARVLRSVRVGPSPLWLRRRLFASGIRSINNVVDVTNYVMLETGHPMHAFDLDKVRGSEISVRRAKPGERLTTLDGKEHDLTGGELLICDREGPTGLAGIMGGLESEITEDTKTILFECASFDRAKTRVVARRLGIRTESSGRFERGVNPATVGLAMERACALAERLGAGEAVPGAADLYPNPKAPTKLTVSAGRISRRAGTGIAASEMAGILRRLDFTVREDGDALHLAAPIERTDIEREEDVCEEVLRLAGYGRIPETLLRGETTPGGDSEAGRLKRKLQDILCGLGFDEVVNFSFTAQKQLDMLGLEATDPRLRPIRLMNPLGEDTAVMRTTLVPDMLRVLAHNMNQRSPMALLCEFATVFPSSPRTQEGLFHERKALSLGGFGEGVDFYTLRDAALALLDALNIPWDIQPTAEPFLHPGRAAAILTGGRPVGVVGEVHPETAERFGIAGRAYVAELDLALMAELARPLGRVKELSRTPAVSRDLALVLDENQPLLPVLRAIEAAGGEPLEEVRLFDVFRG
ncbi:MAG TPA: phenylalanine--tRNA ligase subunit beta, partial [Candidatus Limnocylindria bacterium]|nr:phenylalanine--tRNA ligase subunit beta [Candidatus Limnocylindria bacterium]